MLPISDVGNVGIWGLEDSGHGEPRRATESRACGATEAEEWRAARGGAAVGRLERRIS